MESAVAGTTTNVPEERRLPESRINHVIVLRWAFIDKAISGLGKLALAWATTVLLGGFSTLMKQKDFVRTAQFDTILNESPVIII